MTMIVLPSRPPIASEIAPIVWSTMPCWSAVMFSANASLGSVPESTANIGTPASLAAVEIEAMDAMSVNPSKTTSVP